MLIVGVATLAVALAVGVWPRAGRLSHANWRKVAAGTSVAEVKALLGPPVNGLYVPACGLSDAAELETYRTASEKPAAARLEVELAIPLAWDGADGVAYVTFDPNTGVIAKRWTPRTAMLGRL